MKKLTAFSLILAALLLFSLSSCQPAEEGAEVAVTGLTLNTPNLSPKTGETRLLQATVNPANATNKAVTWAITSPTNATGVATVAAEGSTGGRVSFITVPSGDGKVTVRATAVDGGFTAERTFTVTQGIPAASVSLDKATVQLFPNRTEQLTATVLPADATNKTVTWSSSNTAVATVTNTGKINAVAQGTATITVTTESAGKTATCTVTVVAKTADGNGVEANGQLKVVGANLVNEDNQQFQLYGMSTAGIGYYPAYVNKEAFQTLKDDWKTNCVRLAMYTADNNGYCTNTGLQETLKTRIKNGVQYATELDMYVIIDWHVMNDGEGATKGSPLVYKDQAKAFFAEMAELYKDNVNVLYEICNEPNSSGGTWANITTYANEVIPVIREKSPNAVIIVGTPQWSQLTGGSKDSPLSFQNVMYTLHFYAGTHKDSLRSELTAWRNAGRPVFVSEFAICDASGDGTNDKASGQAWIDLINQHNLSFMAWNLANKNESSCIIKSTCTKLSGWTDDDLSDWGQWIKAKFLAQ